MRVSVKFLVNSRATQPEIRAEIYHFQPTLQQGARDFGRDTMRQRKERDLGSRGRDGIGIRLGKSQFRACRFRETREHVVDAFPRFRARSDCHELHTRMGEQDAEQLHPCISAGSYDGCLDSFHGTYIP